MTAPVVSDRPTPRPFLSARADFAEGTDTPRAFLERCLEALDLWEPRIGAFVNLSIEAARTAADRSTARWQAGTPLSPLDGMPVGVKDIIETIDMPTENGSPLYEGYMGQRDAASVAALREAGAVVVGKTVTTEFASTFPRGTRNPWDTTRTPGGSSSGSAAAVGCGIVSAALGTQVIGSIIRPASYCGCYGFKPTYGAINRGGSFDGLSQSCTGTIAATLEECWQVAYEISLRCGGDPGYPGLFGPAQAPAPDKPLRVAFLETAVWETTSPAARAALDEALARIRAAGVEVITRRGSAAVNAVEEEIAVARARSMQINAWEWRWPLNTYRNRDASKLSPPALQRLADAEAMTLEEYRALITQRNGVRAKYAALGAEVDACVSLSASGCAPVGLQSTGDPSGTVHTSYLGIPTVSLPVLQEEGLPLGLQVCGFPDGDAATFATAAWIATLF